VDAVGGSASTDGGAGALSALGLRLLDSSNQEIGSGGGALTRINHIERELLRKAPSGGVIILTDVDSPLLGPRGAAAIFGPQKGATKEDIELLDSGLAHFSSMLGGDPQQVGSGAAGGTAYGFATAWGAKIASGADYVSKICHLSEKLNNADLLITGEGSLDHQSLHGKVVGQLLTQAQSLGVQSAIIAGQIKIDTGVWSCSLSEIAGSVESAMDNPTHWLTLAGAKAAREFVPQRSR